jgi:hypothetical protein
VTESQKLVKNCLDMLRFLSVPDDDEVRRFRFRVRVKGRFSFFSLFLFSYSNSNPNPNLKGLAGRKKFLVGGRGGTDGLGESLELKLELVLELKLELGLGHDMI